MRNMLSVSPERLDLKSSIDLLDGIIEKAKLLQKDRPFNLQEYAKWNEETRACLTRIYGSDSPNVFSIVESFIRRSSVALYGFRNSRF